MFYILIILLAFFTFYLLKSENDYLIEVDAELAVAAIAHNDHIINSPNTAFVHMKLPRFIQTNGSEIIDIEKKHIGRAKGGSCRMFGIPNEQTYLADKLSDFSILKDKDVVVIKARADFSRTIKKRLRVFKKFNSNGYAEFYPSSNQDGSLKEHRVRPKSELFAVITHLI